MDFLQILMIILMIVGLGLILASVHLLKQESEKNKELNFKVDEAFTLMNNSIEEYENTVSDFNSLAEGMFTEIDEKYQELLLIYSLIDEQKATQNNILTGNENKKVKYDSFIYKNKNSVKIFELYDSGMAVDAIAKKLNIGIGEVQLVINLRKA